VDSFAKQHKAVHFTVSAKNGAKVADMFQNLAERMQATNAVEKSGIGKRGGPQLTVEKDGKKGRSQEKGGCC
jgi:cytochrome b involved in lipid metabolism